MPSVKKMTMLTAVACMVTTTCMTVLHSQAAVVRVGHISPFLSNGQSAHIPVLVDIWSNAYTGLYMAFYEANQTDALGGHQVHLIGEDCYPDFGNGLNETLKLTTIDRVTTLAFVSYYAVHVAMAVAAPQNISLFGALAPDTPTLHGDTQRTAVNYRAAYISEALHILQWAANSKQMCSRFAILYYDVPSVKEVADVIAPLILQMGFEEIIAIPMQQIQDSRKPQLDILLAWGPQCVLFFSAADLVIPHVAEAQSHALYNPDIAWFATSAANLPTYPTGLNNIHLIQQYADPTDRSYSSVRSYQAASQRLFARPGGYKAGEVTAVTQTYNYNQFEGYVLGRLILEVLKRCKDFSPQTFLDTVYRTKMLAFDDITAGPFSDGCNGRSGDSSLPCTCNTGGKFIYIAKVDATDGSTRGLADDPALGEVKVAASEIPFTQCAMRGSNVFRPYTTLHVANAGATASGYSAGLRAATNAIRTSETPSMSHVLLREEPPTRLPASNATAVTAEASRLQLRYAPIAHIGTDSQLVAAVVAAVGRPPAGSNTTASRPAVIGVQREGLRMYDTEDVVTASGRVIETVPVLADYVFAVAAAMEQRGHASGSRVAILCSSAALCEAATKSVNSFGVVPASTTTVSAASVAAALPADGVALLASNDAAVLSAALAEASAAARGGLRLYVGASEAALHAVVGSGGTRTFNAAAAVGRVFFATDLKAFWAFNSTASVAAAATLLEYHNAATAAAAAPSPTHYRAFLDVTLVRTLTTGLRTFTPDAFLDTLFARETVSVFDLTLGPFVRAACASATQRADPDRECELFKAPHRFFLYDLANWSAAVEGREARPAASPSFATATLARAGVKYTPLPSAGTTDRSALIAGVASAAVVLAVLVAAVLFSVFSRGKGKDNSAAPKDASKPFAVAFTDIQSSTSLWARVPQAMGPAVDQHHAIMRTLVKKHRGYEVKTIGDSFMVAFQEAKDAVAFGVEVQQAFFEHNWGTSAIDDVYHDLMMEKLAEQQEQGGGPSILSPRQSKDRSLWNGIRVRVGIHYGSGEIKFDEVQLGYDYYGTVVNTAARVEGVGNGGQVLVTEAVREALVGGRNITSPLVVPNAAVVALGAQPLRGLDEPLMLYQLAPTALAKREFAALRLDVDLAEELDQSASDPEGGSSASYKSTMQLMDNASASSQAHGSAVQVCAARFAERFDRKHPATAYALAMNNYAFLKTLLSTSTEKVARTTIDQLMQRWRVRAGKPPGGSKSKQAMLDYHLMQLTTKVTPASEEKRKDATTLHLQYDRHAKLAPSADVPDDASALSTGRRKELSPRARETPYAIE